MVEVKWNNPVSSIGCTITIELRRVQIGGKKSLNCLASLYCHQSAFITVPLLLGITKDLWYFNMVCMFSAALSM
jgi:hypothetical protein